MRIVLSIIALSAFTTFAQTREFYGGLNTSNYLLTQEGIQSSSRFHPGAQIGFMMGGKSRNLFGNLKRIKPYLNLEYNVTHYEFNEVRNEIMTPHAIDAHSLRLSVPIHIRLSRNSKRIQFHLSGAPGINFTGLQIENGAVYANAPVKSLDLFVNAGGGILLNTLKKEYKREGYKFSGLTLNANKYIPISIGRVGANSPSSLDQYQVSVGLRFSYYNKSAGSKMKDWFKRRKSK